MLLEVNDLIRFEGYVIDRSAWTLKWGLEPIALNCKSFDQLVYLIEHHDRVSSKEELLTALWPEQFIEESNLTQQIFLLRKALSRHESGSKIIENIPGRGYRFTAPVELQRSQPPKPVEPRIVVNASASVTEITIEERTDLGTQTPVIPKRTLAVRALAGLLALALLAAWYRLRDSQSPPSSSLCLRRDSIQSSMEDSDRATALDPRLICRGNSPSPINL